MVNQRPGTRQGNLWFCRGVLILLFEKFFGHNRKEVDYVLLKAKRGPQRLML